MLLYMVFMLLHEVKMVVSSAKTIGNGPRTDPCGTPQVIYCIEDLVLLYITYCFLPDK